MIRIAVYYFVTVNIIAFIFYGIDKRNACKSVYRIPEYMLLLLALVGGFLGAWLGMKYFHHKTLHKKFIFLISLSAFIWIVIAVYFLVLSYRRF